MLPAMSDQRPWPPTLRFGRVELQPLQRRLLVDGHEAPVGARAFDLLLALASRPGQLVTKGELLDEVWPGLVVEEANLFVQVSTLRKVLGAGLIATIPGRGYRFTGVVEAPPDRETTTPGGVVPEPGAATATQRPPVATPAAPSTLIGRQRELSALNESIKPPGCVTLVGPAGVGKTTLARAVAAAVPGGAVWVDLAPLTAGDQLVPAVARSLRMDAAGAGWPERLCAALAGRLLVLDNAEHVVDAAAMLVAGLRQADVALRVLVTSQTRLAVADERIHRLEPLALPPDSVTPEHDDGAVAMFIDRVRAADHRFEPAPAQWPLLREICRQLDGLPLALEMAAARVPALGLAGLAQALQRRLPLLTTGRRDASARHRTVQAALDWSHGLLSAEEQQLYRWCGVFSGGFTLDLLVDVVSGSSEPERRWSVIDTLAQLVDRSLVAVGEGDPPRYRLLETVREDAAQRLHAAGETAPARARLLAALAALGRRCIAADRAEPVLRDALLAEHHNLREAIAWGRQQLDAALRVDTVTTATAAAFVAVFSPWRLEAMQWLESCEPLAEGPDMPTPVQARWWYERSRQWLVSKHEDTRRMAARALELARSCDDELGQFNALSVMVRAPGASDPELSALCDAMRRLLDRHPEWGPARAFSLAGAEARSCDHRGDSEGLLRCRLRELELARQLGDAALVIGVETNLVFALQALNRHDEALLRARDLLHRLGDSEVGNAAYAWTGLIVSLQALGRFDEFRDAVPTAARILGRHRLPLLAPQCALVLAAEGHTVEALRLLGHARARFEAQGMRMVETEVQALARVEQSSRAQLGDAAVDLCLAEGATLDDEAVTALMADTRGRADAAPVRSLARPR
jgi:non-specific serine/threonine protein kinase